MGLWDSFCSIAKSACTVISNAVSNIGKSMVKGATAIASLGVQLASKVSEAIRTVGVSLGVISPCDNLDELGQKAMLSNKKPEDFDSISEYIEHLQNTEILDQEKFQSLDEKDLLARSAIGAEITLKGINEKLDTVVTMKFMAKVAKQELKAQEIIETITTYKENNLKTEDYISYLNDELSLEESDKHSLALVQAYQKIEPRLSIEKIEDRVMELKS